MLETLAVEGYRSLRRVVLPLGQLTVVTGANGSGKSSLYRVLRLLAATARGGVVSALAAEGGLASVLWAGPETIGREVRQGRHPVQGTVRSAPYALRLGFAGADFGYAIDLGLPARSRSMFTRDPHIKCEAVWAGPVLRPAALLTDRRGQAIRLRDADGSWMASGYQLLPTESMLGEIADPTVAPDVLAIRDQVRSWRFFDSFRTDPDAPARGSRPGTWTPVMSDDGADLASALQTLRELGLEEELDAAIDRAFPGSRLEVVEFDGLFALRLHQHGLLRPLGAAELSDGTLRYLLWGAALLSPRPPALFVLNEPETSLHSELLEPLAELISTAAARTQTVVVTHSQALREALEHSGAGSQRRNIELVKDFGETTIAGQGHLDEPAWHWPAR